MFCYRKKTAVIFLVAYILLTAVIIGLSLIPDDVSSAMSNSFYDVLSKIRFGKEKVSENKSDVFISSIEISTSSDRYAENTRSVVMVKSITPEDYTESFRLISSDKTVVSIKSNLEFVTRSEGSADLWLESDGGVRSNVITITVYKKIEEAEIIDPALLEVFAPDLVRRGEAFYPSYTYDGKRTNVGTFTSDRENISKNNKYFAFDEAGTVTLSLVREDATLWQKEIVVTDEIAPEPEIASVAFDETQTGEAVTLIYGKVYSPAVTFKSGESPVFYISFKKDSSPKTSGSYSRDRTSLNIGFLEVGTYELYFFSPLYEEPIYKTSVTVIPPRANVLGLKKTDIAYEGNGFPITLDVTDNDSLIGITCTITHADGLSFRYYSDKEVIFEKEGAYTLTYRSDYYDDFEYSYTVIVESNKNAVSVRKTLGHALLFALLGAFALISFGFFGKTAAIKTLSVALSGAAVAAISEILQLPLFSDGRSATFADVLIDLAGFAVGVVCVFTALVIRYRARLKKSRSASSATVE